MGYDNNYFQNNEISVNNLLIRCAFVLVFVGPAIALMKLVGLTNNFTYKESLALFLIAFAVYGICVYLQKSMRMQFLIKYFLLLGMHAGICYMATKPGILIYICYALMPALSCLYLKRHFTLKIVTISYAIMLFSLYFRTELEIGMETGNLSVFDRFGVFGFVMTWEYAMLIIVLYILVGKIETSIDTLNKNNCQMKDIQTQLVSGFANFLESRDSSTGHHVRRTQAYVRMIAIGMYNQGYYQADLSARSIANLETAAPLHDVGKIAIPDAILLKEGGLTDEEYKKIQNHTREGYRLVTENLSELTDKRLLKCIQEITLSHHERWDGGGYPNHLKGTSIPLSARIMAIADALDAMLSERVYKRSMDLDEVLLELSLESGKHFEPCIVDTVIRIRAEIEEFLTEEARRMEEEQKKQNNK